MNEQKFKKDEVVWIVAIERFEDAVCNQAVVQRYLPNINTKLVQVGVPVLSGDWNGQSVAKRYVLYTVHESKVFKTEKEALLTQKKVLEEQLEYYTNMLQTRIHKAEDRLRQLNEGDAANV